MSLAVNLLDADSLEPMMMESRPKTPDKKRESRKSKDSPKHSKSKENKKAKVEKKKEKKKKTTFNDDILSSFGLQTVDDLLGGMPSSRDDEPVSVASEISEVRTKSESDEIHTEKPEQQNIPVFGRKPANDPFSVSEIRTQATNSSRRRYSDDFEDSISEKIGVSTKVSKMKSVSEIKTRYSGDDTVDDYSESFASDTESIATVSKTSQTSEKTLDDSRTADSESYSYTRR